MTSLLYNQYPYRLAYCNLVYHRDDTHKDIQQAYVLIEGTWCRN